MWEENRLRRIFEPEGGGRAGIEEYYLARNSVVCILLVMLLRMIK
jgi:hypothetical protein